ncbi:MAG TPA: DUF5522 domain-containing protein [Chthonomonadaceae bacterium]|nr:DUF5522 domain-containing protein [Chthonomonadaceae bacterium]
MAADTPADLTNKRPATRALLSWSSGKDAAWSLHALRLSGVEVVALVTTVNREFDRVAMHAVRRTVLERQAAAAGLPLVAVPLPWPCTNAEYEAAVLAALADARERFAVTHIAFGDLFLEDVRAYRERQLAGTGLEPIFPLWGRPTRELAEGMIAGGLRAVLTCVDPRRLPASFAGREFDAALLADLPADVDPCGECGEFHTCAYAGPMFRGALELAAGEVVERDGFVFADLQPAGPAEGAVSGAAAPGASNGSERPDRSDEIAADRQSTPIAGPTADGGAPVAARRVADASASIFDADGALTRAFLLDRGYCCGNGCRNCPYDWEAVPRAAQPDRRGPEAGDSAA